MKKLTTLISALFLLTACGNGIESSVPASVDEGMIVLETPARAEGQESMLQYAAEPLDTVRVGFIGLGMRGKGAVKRFTWIEGAKIAALCDIVPENVEKSQKILSDRGLAEVPAYTGEESWKELCERDDVNLVYICTDWVTHVPMAVYAMEHGKHVAVEVPAAMSIAECWQLIDTSEKTRKHCMMLENCVYDFYEMTVLNMAQQGLFGEVLYTEGGYIHNLDPYWDLYYDGWRLKYNQAHRGDNYPTHGIGPLCQILDIHRGDRMEHLVSMDTKSVVGRKHSADKLGTEDFADGDFTTTLIRTVNGKMIEIQHDVYTRRPYDRRFAVTGTSGYACKYPRKALAVKGENLDVSDSSYDSLDGEKFVPDELFNSLMEQYKPRIVREIEDMAKKVGGHGGMDFIMDSRLVYCLRNGLPLDEDVYDAAEWSCLTELSRLSIENGNCPVAVPDFTRGDWNKVKGFSYAFAK